MPTEIITLTVQPGRRAEFLQKVAETGPAYLAQPGVQSARFFTQIDDDDSVLGVIDWASKADLEAAVASPAGQSFLGAIGPLLAGAPAMRLGEAVPA
ncbi:antibiotic biosynthesis monooxygenase family protein [Herbiconiux sp.]|uniref:putative quinol monooxygenase n=1 Tax=Herbiconiux sp. TaxID=1871186 RepID=UPI0025C55FE2|nr:antibiotic biosynthesis monooxygenase family protein [Herbiconiux sp.]